MQSENPQVGATEKNNNKLLFIAAVIASALISGGLVYFIMHQQSESTAKTVQDLRAQVDNLKKTNTIPATNNNAAQTKEKETNQPTTLTNDQIFKEISTQFNFKREQVNFFRIFGQDKVQYNLEGAEKFFAYKAAPNKTWALVTGGLEMPPPCAQIENAPEQYRPMCLNDDTTMKYVDQSGRSINYPPSQSVSYIGE